MRWYRDAVKGIIQRTYAGLGPDVCTCSENIGGDRGVVGKNQPDAVQRAAFHGGATGSPRLG